MYAQDIEIPTYRNPGKLRLVKPDPTHAKITIEWILNNEVTKYLGADFSGMTIVDESKHLEEMVSSDDK